eukprot:COSAG01_NODE_1904_length_8947_cov_6.556962_4_plen_80_part_00
MPPPPGMVTAVDSTRAGVQAFLAPGVVARKGPNYWLSPRPRARPPRGRSSACRIGHGGVAGWGAGRGRMHDARKILNDE